ncbi:PadR family transcriptional regulator [Lachnospiraceae bacterium NSJ-143]|nr:PadR family transcriptional regulator [Lachnospiraceae bacterium NSJ-143]
MEIDKGLIGGSTVLMLLALLEERDFYGYEIIKELREKSENIFEFKEGTLYPVLHRMENAGLVKSYRKAAESGKERKYYSITAAGLKRFSDEKEQWKTFTLSVNKVIGGRSHAFA